MLITLSNNKQGNAITIKGSHDEPCEVCKLICERQWGLETLTGPALASPLTNGRRAGTGQLCPDQSQPGQ